MKGCPGPCRMLAFYQRGWPGERLAPRLWGASKTASGSSITGVDGCPLARPRPANGPSAANECQMRRLLRSGGRRGCAPPRRISHRPPGRRALPIRGGRTSPHAALLIHAGCSRGSPATTCRLRPRRSSALSIEELLDRLLRRPRPCRLSASANGDQRPSEIERVDVQHWRAAYRWWIPEKGPGPAPAQRLAQDFKRHGGAFTPAISKPRDIGAKCPGM